MSKKLSARIVPELDKRLKESGLLTAIVTLDSPRFKAYLKKPAKLLHDRWSFAETEERQSVVYRIGSERSIRQELTICRNTKQATLLTVDPSAGREQTLVFDLREKSVLANKIVHNTAGESISHNFLFLNGREGMLRRATGNQNGNSNA